MWFRTKSVSKRAVGAAISTLVFFAVLAARTLRSASSTPKSPEKTMATQSKFYCNMKVLSHTERVRHLMLTGKLIMLRNKIVELQSGYEFQFSPSTVSIAD